MMRSISGNMSLFFLFVSLFLISILCATETFAEKDKPLAANLVTEGQRVDISSTRYTQLFHELETKHQFSIKELNMLFKNVTINRKVLVLMDKQWEATPYYSYRKRFITPFVIARGKHKLFQHRKLLARIEEKFGVDKEFIIAIWGIETKFGSYTGNFNVFRSLNTLFDAYPRRSAFFREQLIHFLLLCRENGIAPHSVKGSYAGAFGQTQFIPSSFRKYAVSFDGDKKRDVFSSTADILASIANYLHSFGWVLDAPVYHDIGNTLNSARLTEAFKEGRKGRIGRAEITTAQHVDIPPVPGNKKLSIVGLEHPPRKGGGYRYVAGYPNFQAITEWNHSNRYAMAVTELAEALR